MSTIGKDLTGLLNIYRTDLSGQLNNVDQKGKLNTESLNAQRSNIMTGQQLIDSMGGARPKTYMLAGFIPVPQSKEYRSVLKEIGNYNKLSIENNSKATSDVTNFRQMETSLEGIIKSAQKYIDKHKDNPERKIASTR